VRRDHDAARALLGVAADASRDEVRSAYRALMLLHHPDVARHDPSATTRAAELTSAYALLLSDESSASPAAAPPPPADPPPTTQVRADGAILVEAPGPETFMRVLDALESIGDVTYRDRSGFLQAIVQPVDGPLCTMAVAIEPRALDTLVLVSLDSMDSNAAPPVEPILHELARLIGTD
jgi:hypothetical protein